MGPAMANPFISTVPGVQSSQELMRLTAAADDLRSRLKASTDKCCHLETQLQRSQHMISRERQDAQHQISAVRQEVASVRDSELKLRSELASRPTVTEFKQNKFHDAVRTAMEAEEMQARVADSEARINTLSKRAEALKAEVKLLESARSEAVEVAAANSKAMFTEEQISEKLASLADADTKVTTAEQRLSVLADDIAKNEAMRDSHRSDATKAEMELLTANEALVAAVADLTATKQEQGETALKITAMKDKLAEVEADVEAAQSKAFEALTVPPAPDALSKHVIEVTGAMPPSTILGFPVDSTPRRVDAMGCSGCGVPYHLGIDAPITIGAHSGADGAAPIDDMIKAIVMDLKGYFAFAAEENAKRGIARGSATGDAVEVPAEIEVM